jgi:septal ring factor EnvC (AmiA/AmiB activator)
MTSTDKTLAREIAEQCAKLVSPLSGTLASVYADRFERIIASGIASLEDGLKYLQAEAIEFHRKITEAEAELAKVRQERDEWMDKEGKLRRDINDVFDRAETAQAALAAQSERVRVLLEALRRFKGFIPLSIEAAAESLRESPAEEKK